MLDLTSYGSALGNPLEAPTPRRPRMSNHPQPRHFRQADVSQLSLRQKLFGSADTLVRRWHSFRSSAPLTEASRNANQLRNQLAEASFMPGQPSARGRLLQTRLPGEPKWLSPQPPQPHGTSSHRPLTSAVPIFNPTLDRLFSPRRTLVNARPLSMERRTQFLSSSSRQRPLDPLASTRPGQNSSRTRQREVMRAASSRPLAMQSRRGSLKLTSHHPAFRHRLTILNLKEAGSQAARQAGSSVSALLKKLYRDQELLNERQAVNFLSLILRLGGDFTFEHSTSVLDLALELADEFGVTDPVTRQQIRLGSLLKDIGEMGFLLDRESPEKREAIAQFLKGELLRAGLLHDIGKIRIPPEILHKPGPLTDEEYAIIKLHPVHGERIVYPIASLRHLCPAIRGHHERWDGGGYPDGLRGEQIPLAARVIAVADVYDALATERPYKRKMEPEKIRNVFRKGQGTQFDPALTEAFLRVLARRQPIARGRF